MSKNPAINFYTGDFLTGTSFMTNEQIGAYIRLLSYQHQLGHLSEEQVFSITKDEKVLSKFLKDKKGKYFNKRMELEINKKKKYSESRANNRKKHLSCEKDMKNICNSYDEHMENEIEIENKNKNKNKNKNNLFSFIEINYGRTISSVEYNKIDYWLNNFNEDIIQYAIEISCLNNAKSISYVDAILENWKSKGYQKLSEIKNQHNQIKKESEQPIELVDYDWLNVEE